MKTRSFGLIMMLSLFGWSQDFGVKKQENEPCYKRSESK
jgi:hypothetical protein